MADKHNNVKDTQDFLDGESQAQSQSFYDSCNESCVPPWARASYIPDKSSTVLGKTNS